MFNVFSRRSRAATPPPALQLPAQPSGPVAPAAPSFVDDVEDYSLSLVCEARARYDRLRQIPRDELLRRALMGQLYDCYRSGDEWFLVVPPQDGMRCFPRTTPALWQYHITTGEPLAFD